MKIKDLVVNTTCDIPLVVSSASAKETRAKKPYLALELTDGIETIHANYWDWLGKNIPSPNDILNVKGNVTEWNGSKQLTIRSLTSNTEKTLNDFSPVTDIDVAEVYKDAYTLASTISNDVLRNLTIALFEELYDRWLVAPGAVRVHHNYVGGALVHSYSVASIAAAIAEHTKGANRDLCIAGGLLHDIGKLYAYELDGLNVMLTDRGKLYDHVFMGAEFVGNYAETLIDADDRDAQKVLALLRHIILSHHGKREWGSPVEPLCIEAFIVHMSDNIDATSEQIRKAVKDPEDTWTDTIRTLNNSRMFNPDYIERTISECNLPF